MEIENLIARLKCPKIQRCPIDRLYPSCTACQKNVEMEAATALEQLQAENDKLKEIVCCYCDMCIEQDGVLWCQSCDEKCDYCIHPKEASHD